MTSEETRRIICALEDIGYKVSMTDENTFQVVFNTRKPMWALVKVEPLADIHDRANEIIAKYYDQMGDK